MDTGKRFPIPDADRNPKGYLRLEKRRKETSGGVYTKAVSIPPNTLLVIKKTARTWSWP